MSSTGVTCLLVGWQQRGLGLLAEVWKVAGLGARRRGQSPAPGDSRYGRGGWEVGGVHEVDTAGW